MTALGAAAWSALLTSLPQPACLVDAGTLRVVAANAAAHSLLGRTPGALLGEAAAALLLTPEDDAYWRDAAAGVVASLESETIVATSEGAARHVSRSIRPVSSPVANAGGHGPAATPSHYMVMLVDRTATREAEDHREMALAELQATLEATADGILVTDLAGRIRAFNGRFAELWALPADLVSGAPQHEAVHDWLRRSVEHGDAYQRRLSAIAEASTAQAVDRLELHTGQVFERVARPLWLRGRPMGRVYSFRDLTKSVAADQRIHELSHTDALTGLANRGQIAHRISAASSGLAGEPAPFALLLVDLDRFRAINEGFGTDTGDQVLREVTRRLRSCSRDGDLAARIGGDQFALLVHRADVVAAEVTARRVLDAVAQPCAVDGAAFTVTCSVGIALFPQHGADLDELMHHAESAVRLVKQAGRASWRISPARGKVDRRAHMRLDHAMRQALAAQRFRLHYQPQVDLNTGAVVGAEALIRWRDAELGDVSPGRFIPVAEETGFIIAIGDWVMGQAVRQAAVWRDQGYDLPVAINVSALQFQQPGFVDRVATVLAAHGLEPRWLELELTESILVHDAEDTLNRLNALARLGVKLSIDDFGTGYSSLSYLKRFPIDKLKIDRSFVQGLPGDDSDASIVRAIVQMAQALGIRVIAEGVETEGQRAFLQHAGCGQFQGFLFAPALDAARFVERLPAVVLLPAPAPAASETRRGGRSQHVRLVRA